MTPMASKIIIANARPSPKTIVTIAITFVIINVMSATSDPTGANGGQLRE